MPLYEYDCHGCKRHLEIIQKFSDAPLTCCPECGGELVKRLSLTSFQLKGSGWYATDYKKSSSPISSASSESSNSGTTQTGNEPAKSSKD